MTSLTDLQRWAREKGTPLAPQALRTLKAEGFLEAEAVATLPSSELLKLPYVKESSIGALRAWQAEQGIPVPPDPEVEAPNLRGISGGVMAAHRERGRDWKDFMGVDTFGAMTGSRPLQWLPQTEKEQVAYTTYLELLKPSPVMGERVNAVEAMKQAWLAADAWERERTRREADEESKIGEFRVERDGNGNLIVKGESDGNESHSDAG